jgi:hypothetical protein
MAAPGPAAIVAAGCCAGAPGEKDARRGTSATPVGARNTARPRTPTLGSGLPGRSAESGAYNLRISRSARQRVLLRHTGITPAR